MANGVHGMIDFTVPVGGSSVSIAAVGALGITDESNELGSMNLMLEPRQ